MRFSLKFRIQNITIPLDYRRKFLSFLKATLESYDKSIYNSFYNGRETIEKDFTFSVFIPNQTFNKSHILAKGNILYLNLSFYNTYEGLHVYTAILSKINSTFQLGKENKMTLLGVDIKKESLIFEEKIKFKLISPLLVREHNRDTNKDWFYTFEDNCFEEKLKMNIYTHLKEKFPFDIESEVQKLIFDFSKMKKTVITNYSIQFPGSLGIFTVQGNPHIIDYFYKAGFGSKSSAGFGMLDIINDF